jgi:WD40 repeat protein
VQKTNAAGFSGSGQFAVSDSGTLVYVEGSGDDLFSLIWIDRSGKAEVVGAPKRRYIEPRVSPDGLRIAASTRDESPDIFVWDLRTRVETRVTKDDVRDLSPMWIDDRELLFGNEASGKLNLSRRRADLTTERTTLADTKENEMPLTISPDGKTVVVGVFPSNASYLGFVSLDKPEIVTPLLSTSYPSANAVISPDGHWIAYEAREGEITEVFVRPFPNVNDGRYPISQGGGAWPVWSRTGKELFYVANRPGNSERFLLAVPITRASGTTFDWSPGVRLFNAAPYMRTSARGLDISRDGTKFVFIGTEEGATTVTRSTIRYVTNWIDEVRARAK